MSYKESDVKEVIKKYKELLIENANLKTERDVYKSLGDEYFKTLLIVISYLENLSKFEFSEAYKKLEILKTNEIYGKFFIRINLIKNMTNLIYSIKNLKVKNFNKYIDRNILSTTLLVINNILTTDRKTNLNLFNDYLKVLKDYSEHSSHFNRLINIINSIYPEETHE